MENNKDQSRDLFLCKQDICNMVGKLAKTTHKKHENNGKSVQMWVFENKDKVFFYQESGVKVVPCRVVTCLSQLSYKLNGRNK